jgi:hypothetical protein
MKKILFGLAAAALVVIAAVSVASSGAATCDPGSCPKHCCGSK